MNNKFYKASLNENLMADQDLTELVKTYTFKGKKIEELRANVYGIRIFHTTIEQSDLIDLLYSLDISTRINLKDEAYPIYRALKAYGWCPSDYVSNEEIVIEVADRYGKIESLDDIRDEKLRGLVEQRRLEEYVLGGLSPADSNVSSLDRFVPEFDDEGPEEILKMDNTCW